MAVRLWVIVLLSFLEVFLQAEAKVFVKKENADQILWRHKRANSPFEEFKKGNLERECIEERCSYEEAREVYENDVATKIFWNIYIDGNQCELNPCHYGGKCIDGIGEYTCLCLEGFEGTNCDIVTPKLCSLENGGCEQFCKAIEKNVICTCTKGYILGVDGKSCIPTEIFPCGKRQVTRKKRSVLMPHEHSVNDSKSDVRQQNSGTGVNVTHNEMDSSPAIDYISPTETEDPFEESNPDTRIVGGKECKPGECPWQALLVNEKKEGFCGGTILNEYFVLTAAHCMNQSKYFEVVVGEVDTQKKEGTESFHKVEQIIMHQKFVLQTYDFDIALLKLKQAINFTQYVIPVCIPDVDFADDFLMSRNDALVSGFGLLYQRGQQATKLQVLHVPYIERQICIESSTYAITKNMFCAGYEAEGRDACQGDSGGPHVTPYRDTYFITGIVSWGEGCAKKGKYGVYTKVSRFNKWLKAAMKAKPQQ